VEGEVTGGLVIASLKVDGEQVAEVTFSQAGGGGFDVGLEVSDPSLVAVFAAAFGEAASALRYQHWYSGLEWNKNEDPPQERPF